MVKKKKAAKPRPGKAPAKPRKRAKPKKPAGIEASMEKIGVVTHYFPHVNAAVVKILKKSLKAGEEVYVKGHTTDFKETVDSMQLDHVPIQEAKKGQEIGLFVKSRVRIGDNVYRMRA